MAFKSSKHVALAAIGMAAALGAAWWFQKPAPPRTPGRAAARGEAGRGGGGAGAWGEGESGGGPADDPARRSPGGGQPALAPERDAAPRGERPRHAAQFPRWPAGAARAVAGA